MADRPLRPATDHCLGGLLPRQLANRPQAPPEAPEFLPVYFPVSSYYAVLAAISSCYPPLQGRSPTYYSPVRHFQGYCYPLTFDLHVLGTPPAFILSQDQTLHKELTGIFLRRYPDRVSQEPLSVRLLSYHSSIVNVLVLPSTLFQYFFASTRAPPFGFALANARVYFTTVALLRQISGSLFALYFSIAAFSYFIF